MYIVSKILHGANFTRIIVSWLQRRGNILLQTLTPDIPLWFSTFSYVWNRELLNTQASSYLGLRFEDLSALKLQHTRRRSPRGAVWTPDTVSGAARPNDKNSNSHDRWQTSRGTEISPETAIIRICLQTRAYCGSCFLENLMGHGNGPLALPFHQLLFQTQTEQFAESTRLG